MKTQGPLILTFVLGIILLISFFIPHEPFGTMERRILNWYIVMAGFTYLLAMLTLVRFHIIKIKRKEKDAIFSWILLASFVITLIWGFGEAWTKLGGFWASNPLMPSAEVNGKTVESMFYKYFYMKIYISLQGTMFSLLGFFIASAAYRAFRVRSFNAALLLIAAILVMLGRIPVGERMWSKFPLIANWLVGHLQAASYRGISLGIALGGFALSLRLLLGIERSYMR